MPNVPKMSVQPTSQVDWKPISIAIAELWALAKEQRLVLRPDFQRRAVWSEKAQKNLIDTVLRNLPMPKVLFATEVFTGSKTLRRVIDGQQRLTAIFHFLENRFRVSVNDSPMELYFDELSAEAKRQILEYKIDGNDIFSGDDKLIREIYSRVNKYNIALNRQELRKADFPGDFLMEAEGLADLSFFEDARIFTGMQRRRMLDVEFTSELLVVLLEGVQDKKDSLDVFCQKYQAWESESRNRTRLVFTSLVDQIDTIFKCCGINLGKTRFRQKSDFYSLFAAIFELGGEGPQSEMNWAPLASDLRILDVFIAPESPIDLLSTYAVKCVSDANSISSRRWRSGLLKSFLKPSLLGEPDAEDIARFAQIRLQLPDGFISTASSSATTDEGALVRFDVFDPDESEKYWVAWNRDEWPMQMSNMIFVSEARFSAKEHKYRNCFSLNELALNYFLTSDA
jgi:hypothetical protein